MGGALAVCRFRPARDGPPLPVLVWCALRDFLREGVDMLYVLLWDMSRGSRGIFFSGPGSA